MLRPPSKIVEFDSKRDSFQHLCFTVENREKPVYFWQYLYEIFNVTMSLI